MRAVVLLALAAAASCYSPSIPDNTYQCTDPGRTCPAGMVCNSCLLCVHAGSPVNVGPCQSCGRLAQCFIDQGCQYGDTSCAVGCLANGSPTAQQLGQATLDCVSRVCALRCEVPSLPDCAQCLDNASRGTGSQRGLCSPAGDFACGRCLNEYNACIADQSGI